MASCSAFDMASQFRSRLYPKKANFIAGSWSGRGEKARTTSPAPIVEWRRRESTSRVVFPPVSRRCSGIGRGTRGLFSIFRFEQGLRRVCLLLLLSPRLSRRRGTFGGQPVQVLPDLLFGQASQALFRG